MRHHVVVAVMFASLAGLARAQSLGQAGGALFGRSDAVELRVESMRLSARYGPIKAGEGRQFLVLQTTWRNVIQGDVVTPYKVPDLSDQLFLIAGGARVVPMTTAVRGRPGVLNPSGFTVGRENLAGAILFDLPAGDPGDLMLAMIDENNGVIRVPLAGKAPTPPEDKPRQQNEILDVIVAGTREVPGKTPPGTKLLAVDLRWSSRVRAPKAKTGRLVNIPDWKETFQVIVDGEFVSPVVDAPTERIATILPEIFTGGEFVFRVPADRSTARLDLHFSQAQLPGDKKMIRPKSISFELQSGAAPPLPTAKQTWGDSFFDSRLVDMTPTKLGNSDGTLMRFRVTNKAKSWETLQPYSQYRVQSKDRAIGADAGYTKELPRGAFDDNVLIPPGQTRQFDLAFAGEATQLMYASAEPDGAVAIELVAGGKVATTPQRSAIARTRQPEDDAPEAKGPPEPVLKPVEYPPLPDAATLKAKGLAGVGLKPEQVNTAIDRGADALWQVTREHFVDTRSLVATDMLAALAMTYSGLHKRNAEFNLTVDRAIQTYRPGSSGTYEAGIMLMLIESYGSPAHLPLARELAQGLVDSQCADGSWQYSYVAKPKEIAKASVVTNGPIQLTAGDEPQTQNATGVVKRSNEKPLPEGGDNSTTQYAVLGLASAERMGIAIDPGVWRAAAKVTASRQNPDEGGWAYHQVSQSYGSMTAAGMTSLSIAKHYSADKAAKPAASTKAVTDAAIQRALRWFNAYFAVSRHPQATGEWLYYYLYGVERVGRVLDTEFLGAHEWYPQGARFLVDNQGRDGAWRGKSGNETYPEYATSFALLFLTKATPTLDGKKAQLDTGTLAINAKAAERAQIYFILDCSGSMLAEINGKMKFDIARDAVKSIVNSLPDHIEVGLRVYGHRKRAIEKDADKDVEELVRLAPLDRKQFLDKLDALRSRGKTPLAESLTQTAKSLDGVKGPTPVTVILLTDGGEDTRPRGNPVAAAAEFAKLPNTRLKIIGFDINQDDWAKQLADMAAAAKGTYVAAADADKLSADLVAAVAGVPDKFTVTDEKGVTVASGVFGQNVVLKPGKYKFATSLGSELFTQDLYIAAGRNTTLRFAP